MTCDLGCTLQRDIFGLLHLSATFRLAGWHHPPLSMPTTCSFAECANVRIGFGFGRTLKCSLSEAQLGVRDGYCGGRYFLLTVFFTVPLTSFFHSMGECESSSSTQTTCRKAVACGGWHPALLLGIASGTSGAPETQEAEWRFAT